MQAFKYRMVRATIATMTRKSLGMMVLGAPFEVDRAGQVCRVDRPPTGAGYHWTDAGPEIEPCDWHNEMHNPKTNPYY